jgi:hypothetical protein
VGQVIGKALPQQRTRWQEIEGGHGSLSGVWKMQTS